MAKRSQWMQIRMSPEELGKVDAVSESIGLDNRADTVRYLVHQRYAEISDRKPRPKKSEKNTASEY